jgi:protein phosphatase
VHGLVDDGTIERVLASEPDAAGAVQALVAAALDAGGEDNATAVVVDVVG